MVLSLLFIILLRFLAGIMVWVMIVMVILVLGYGVSPRSLCPSLPKVYKMPLPFDLLIRASVPSIGDGLNPVLWHWMQLFGRVLA